jgi:two-component system response regulator DesR
VTRCLLADDHAGVLEAISAFLEAEGIDVVAQVQNGAAALDAIRELAPDVAIVDARMPGLSGIDVAREVTRCGHATRVIVYTGAADRALIIEAIDAGAGGFLLKDAPLANLLRAIEVVRDGGTYVDVGLVNELMSGSASVELTQRERDVLRLLADGND